MNLLQRIHSRLKEEGWLKTVQYSVLVGADSLKTYLRDSYLDLKYSGQLLHGNKSSNYKHLGANDVYHTDYSVMPLTFNEIKISPDDILVDVGCGKGRVINYWLSRNYKNPIFGIEIDPQIAIETAMQFSSHPNVKVICGDAIDNLPSDGTIFYFYNPFHETKVFEFEQKARDISGDNPIVVIYYNPKSLHVFENGHWIIRHLNFEKDLGVRRWGRLNKYHDLAIITKISNQNSHTLA